MDINEEILKVTDKIIAEQLPVMLEKSVTNMLEQVLKDLFSSYSKTSKDVKEVIEKSLNVNLQKYDLIDYNALVAGAINNHLVKCVNENSIEPIMKMVESATGFIEKKKMKMSEIHEMIIGASKDYNDDDSSGEISFYIDNNEEHGWYTVSYDIEKDVDKKDCSIEFLVSSRGSLKTIFTMRTKSYSSKKGNLTPTKIMNLSNLEHKIFRLYSAQVEIEVNETDFDNTWYRYED
jgi:hypothetical protein